MIRTPAAVTAENVTAPISTARRRFGIIEAEGVFVPFVAANRKSAWKHGNDRCEDECGLHFHGGGKVPV